MISGIEYKVISDKIHELQDVLVNTESVSIDMQSTVTQLQNIYIGTTPFESANEVDYFDTINQGLISIEEGSNLISSSGQLDALIRALQNHVLARYDSIDDFLEEEEILVKQRFYDLSNTLGFEITSAYLE
jgi:hypothetical protein